MVTVETRVQLAIKEFLIEEIEKHLNTGDNFDVVLSIDSVIDPYEEEPDLCEPYKEIFVTELECVLVVTMGTKTHLRYLRC